MVDANWKGKILVVDDNAMSIEMIRPVLEGEGYEVVAAIRGDQAVGRAGETFPDLILLDVMMPGIDGFETCRCLKAQKKTRDIPVIFMTGLAAVEDKVKGFTAGGADYVTKPINMEEVIARIKTHVALRKTRERLESRNLELRREIGRRRQLEKTLRESEAQKRAILHASIDRIRYVDKKMRIIWANRTMAEGVNLPAEALVGHTCHRLQHDRKTPCDGCPTVRSRQSGNIERAIVQKPHTRGLEGESYWDIYCVPLKNDAGEIEHFIQIERDITLERRSEEQIQLLSHELMKAQENERLKISHELHDHVAQDLASLKIEMDTLFDRQAAHSGKAIERASEISERLRRIIVAVRDMAYGLRPPLLDQFGLVRTISEYCENLSQAGGIDIAFTHDGMPEGRFDFDTEINLYRLVQEGLNNIKKHADARHVAVDLVLTPPKIFLSIKDDGKGFDVEKMLASPHAGKRMGLRNMRERINLLGGRMRIESRPKDGTWIFITVPARVVKSPQAKGEMPAR